MIKASECRLGGLFKYYGGQHQGEIIGLKLNSISDDSKVTISAEGGGYTQTTLDDLDGIRLTESWLIKFGFEFLKKKSGTQGVYSNGIMNLSISNSGNVYRINKIIPYVHTLQNLSAALYDQELTVKG